MHHNLIIKDGDTTKVVKEVLVDGIQFVDEVPRAGSTNPVTSDGVKGAIGKSTNDVLDDNDDVGTEMTNDSRAFYDGHELGYYYAIGDKVWLCTEHTRSGSGPYTYSTTLTKINGIVPVLNQLVDRIAALDDRITALENA